LFSADLSTLITHLKSEIAEEMFIVVMFSFV
jgi:hypothetical protein